MRGFVTRSTACVLMIFAYRQLAVPDRKLSVVERVIVFSVQQEIKASNLAARRDLCVGFGHGLLADQKAIISDLTHTGIQVHAIEWCNRGPRGISVDVISPINEVSPGAYEVNIAVGDLSIPAGQHFAALLKRGTYVINCAESSEPQLVSYRQTCCLKAS